MWKASQAIRDDIKHLEEMLRGRREALAAVERSEAESQSIDGEHARFINVKKPIEAMLIVLKENENRMKEADLIAAIIKDGAMHGKESPTASAQTSVTQSVRAGTLIRDGLYVSVGEPRSPRVRKKPFSVEKVSHNPEKKD